MEKEYILSQLLSTLDYLSLLEEFALYFKESRPDAFLNEQVEKLLDFRESFYESNSKQKPHFNVKAESDALNRCLVAMDLYVNTCRYDSDKAVVAAAQAVHKRIHSFKKPIAHMILPVKMTTVELLLSFLNSPDYAPYVELMPDLPARMDALDTALDDLRAACRRRNVDRANAKKPEKLRHLKRGCAEVVETLYNYLKLMAMKDPEQYRADFQLVDVVIKRFDAKTRHRKRKKAAPTVKMQKS